MASEQRNNSRLLWIIIGGISSIIIVFLVVQWFFADGKVKPNQNAEVPVQTQPKPQTATTADSTESQPATSEAAPNTLIDESIMNSPIPENPSLAKEEVARLQDIKAQLKAQEETLKSQHQDVDKLIELKEEQIKLIEAQLEAQ